MFQLPFSCVRSIVIDKPAAEVFASLADFKQWRAWSPWLSQEPSCPVKVEGTPGSLGHGQAWDGKIIGAGHMTLKAMQQDQRLDYDLVITKPWKSQSKVSFVLQKDQSGNRTQVSWAMQGSVPVFLFFMRKFMSAFIGMDYVRGLGMLKDYLEQGTVHSKVELKGVTKRSSFHYMGHKRKCALRDLGDMMSEDFSMLDRQLKDGKFPKPDFAFSIYHKYDIPGGTCEYTSGFGYRAKPATGAGNTRGTIAEHQALQVDHTGPYKHLGNAWSAAIGCQRNQKHKTSKSVPMYEIYKNMPGEVADAELKTEIYLPLRS